MITAGEKQGLIVMYFLYGKEPVTFDTLMDVKIGNMMIFSDMAIQKYLIEGKDSNRDTTYQLTDKAITEVTNESRTDQIT